MNNIKHKDKLMRKPVIIIGDPGSVFAQIFSSYWLDQGDEVIIINHNWQGENKLPSGARVLATKHYESIKLRRFIKVSGRIIKFLENLLLALNKKSYDRLKGEREGLPRIYLSVIRGISIASFLRRLNPKFIFGMEVFSYGFATALCKNTPRVLMPWGGDIYTYSKASLLSFMIVRYSLRHVDLVCPSASTSVNYIHKTFKVPKTKIMALSWGVDPKNFKHSDPINRKNICRGYGIHQQSIIVTNIRRFKPIWVSNLALKAFCKLAKEYKSLHFVLIAGSSANKHISEARKKNR